MTVFLVIAFSLLFVVQVMMAAVASANPQGGSTGAVVTFVSYAFMALGGFALTWMQHHNWALALIVFLCVADYWTVRLIHAHPGD